MINNFDAETSPLTEDEKRYAMVIAARIKQNIGEKRAVTSQKIMSIMRNDYHAKISGPRLRKIINYIRLEGLVVNLVASSKGYYVETDPEKISAYVDSLVQRAEAIYTVARSFNTGLPMYWTHEKKEGK